MTSRDTYDIDAYSKEQQNIEEYVLPLPLQRIYDEMHAITRWHAQVQVSFYRTLEREELPYGNQ
jgi:hypothetical protein